MIVAKFVKRNKRLTLTNDFSINVKRYASKDHIVEQISDHSKNISGWLILSKQFIKS